MGNLNNGDPSLHLRFVALLLHDMETPFAVAKQFLKRVQEGRFDPQNPNHKRLLSSSQLALERGEQILSDLLDQVRGEKEGLTLHCSPIQLDELIAKCIAVVYPLAEDKDVSVKFPSSSAVSLTALGDPRLVSRILDNLLSNAIRHTPRGTAIWVQASVKNGQIQIDVANSMEDNLDFDPARIFDPVYQVEMRSQRRVRGTGLGLTFSKMAVEAHGGEIYARREEKNMIFTFTLPEYHQGDHHG